MRKNSINYINIAEIAPYMKNPQKITIVMPAYNEEKVIGRVIKGLKNEGFKSIIVVDDGSTDKTYSAAKKENILVYRHNINRGLGGALGTGIRAALQNNADIIVTFDADGQHNPAEIKKIIKPIQEGKADFVIGSRLKNPEGMPWIRRIGNWGFNLITFVLFGVWTTDSQSGFRAFSADAARKIEIRTNRMEVSSEFFTEIRRNKLRFVEVPVKAVYTRYSMEKGQSSLNAFKILAKLILRRIMG